jgi:hypothetical protein
MSVLRWVRPSAMGAVAVALLFLAPAPWVSPAAAHAASGAPPPGGPCAGAALVGNYSGSLTREGGPLPASALANVSMRSSYAYETSLVNRSSGSTVSVSCTSATGDSATNASGEFPVALPLPPDTCSRSTDLCEEVSGPYGPLAVRPVAPPPAGYESSTSIVGRSVSVRFVAELASVALSPGGPVAVYSPDASEGVRAIPLAGNASPSPVAPAFTWTLTGTGWNLLGAATGASVNLTASGDAGSGELEVVASWQDGGTTFEAGPANLSLEAVATSVVTASENQSAVDAGSSVAVALTASGAPGYAYSASLLPGLGLPASALGCTPEAAAGADEVVACSGNVSYPDAGSAAPEVEVSNGYSGAEESLPSVEVSPPPAVQLSPSAPFGYTGAPTPVRVAAVAGTGTAPYRMACLDVVATPLLCSRSPGPNWTFAPSFAAPGTYVGSAWTVDATGANASVPVSVAVASPLEVSPLAGPPGAPVVGENLSFGANLSGGFLPARYWWNVSGTSLPVASGWIAEDGPIAVGWVPPSAGAFTLTLTVTDAHGTSVDRSSDVVVGNDPARSVAAVESPPADGVVAGTSVGLAWQALDAYGAAASSFAGTAELRLSFPGGVAPAPAWVNVSGIGPLSDEAPGLFGVPSSAWILGRLNLSVATTVAGTLSVSLVDLVGVGAPPPLVVTVTPDLAHLHFFAPEVALAGDRTNRTFWHVEDQFGNPAEGTSVDVEFSGDGVSDDNVTPVLGAAGHSSGVWVNFSAPTSAGGSLVVWGPVGDLVLLGPIEIPSAVGPAGPWSGLAPLLLGVAAALAVAGVVVRFRPRRRPDPSAAEPTDGELRRFVEGRDRVIAAVRDAGVADLARLEADWGEGLPPPELADWVASLVADGTLGARTGPDGVARFCLSGSPLGPPRVLVDEGLREAARRTRDAATTEDGERPSD